MKPKIDKRFGRLLRRIRAERGIGVRELARMIGVHPTYISKIELGELPAPAWDKIVASAHILKSEELVEIGRDALLKSLLDGHEAVLRSAEKMDPAIRGNMFGFSDFDEWKRWWQKLADGYELAFDEAARNVRTELKGKKRKRE